jgi:exosortase
MTLTLAALGLVLGWWIYDLQVHWRDLVDYQYGWLVVVMSAYLVWERWPTRPQDDQPVKGWIALTLAGIAAPFILIAELYKHAVAHSLASSFSLSIGCTLFACALILSALGARTLRHFLFPLLFLYVAVPLPKILWNPIVFFLQDMVASLNVGTLNLMGIPAVQQAHVIRLPNCAVGVDEACSGVRSLQSSIMAALFLGDLTLKKRSLKWLCFFAGIALAVFGNYVRSVYLSLTAYRHGLEAIGTVHDMAGWSILLGTAVGLVLLIMLANRLDKPR